MPLTKVYIDTDVADWPETRRVLSRIHLPWETVRDSREVFDNVASADDPVGFGKQVLYLTRNKGAFVKDCPGTREYTCCGYRILHIGTYCTMDCAYCVLQSYFHPPVLQYFVNHGDLMEELQVLFQENRLSRIGTGEFTDSLIWENWSDESVRLVTAFAAQNRAVLEFKTKTTAIDQLQALPHNRKTILAWSLNSERIVSREERRTASLSARLTAAARAQSWGYPLAFHFDPLVIYDGCEEDYRQTIQRLFAVVDPDNIVWISLGTFRFMPALKPIITRRFPRSRIIYGEFIRGLDGKMRYFKPLRIQLYRSLVSSIRQLAPGVCVYLCMEDETVWQKTLGVLPSQLGGLSRMLDESAARHCGLRKGFD
jgi:spore photoproduct lyase